MWEDEKSVLEEGLATLGRVERSYRDRLSRIENCLQFGTVAQPDVNVAQSEAAQVRFVFDVLKFKNDRNCSIHNKIEIHVSNL